MPLTTKSEVKTLLQIPEAVAAVYRLIASNTVLANTESVTIGSVVYTFKNTPTVKNDILVQATTAAQAAVLIKAINGVADAVNIPFEADPILGFTAELVDTDDILLTADVAGVGAGTITITPSNLNKANSFLVTSPKDSDVSKDALIDSLIVKVQDFIVRRINNFIVPEYYFFGDNISFDSSTSIIADGDSGIDTGAFAVGNDILVLGSYQNDKVFSIKSVSESEIEVNETLTEEAAGNLIYIRRIQFTEDIKIAAADFIASKLNKEKSLKSKSLGDHSESYFTQTEMLDVFAPFKKLQWD